MSDVHVDFEFEEKTVVMGGREYRQFKNGGLEDCETGIIAAAPPHWVDGNGGCTYEHAQEWLEAMDSLGATIETVDKTINWA